MQRLSGCDSGWRAIIDVMVANGARPGGAGGV